jgi:hypothetical protein
MSLIWITAAAILAPPVDASAISPGQTEPSRYESAADQPTEAKKTEAKKIEREAHVWRRDIADAMRREATAIGGAHEAAVLDLVDLYIELRDATTLAESEYKRLGKTVKARLARVAEKMQRQIDRAKKEAKGKPVKIHEFAVLGQVLAQQQAFGAPNFGNLGGLGGIPGATNGDHGQELVDLIQKVIAPDTWDIAGGPGSIMYYSPQRVIVVRQTGEVHRQFKGVLNQLRRN